MIEFSQILEIISAHWEIILLFFTIAILYASAGFGGGSSYLAILALTGLAYTQIRAISLFCNIVAVSSGSYIFARNGHFDWKKIIPLVLLSVPMAFVGGYLKISLTFFFALLGITLTIAALLMWFSKNISNFHPKNNPKKSVLKDTSIGAIIGFVSGMVGIGGGVFLAPVLYLTKWDTPKKIATASSFFILVNSVSGLIGQFQNPDFFIDPTITFVLMFTVFIGGQIGSRLSANFISPHILKKITAVIIAIVGIKILYNFLY